MTSAWKKKKPDLEEEPKRHWGTVSSTKACTWHRENSFVGVFMGKEINGR